MRGTRNRPGFSLLEVLISIGVLTVGILSLAVLIPVGRLAIEESIIADRAGTCGRAGLRDIKARGMLDPTQWYTPVVNPKAQVAQVPGLGLWSFAIDPLFIAEHPVGNDPDNLFIQSFPYICSGNTSGPPAMQRVTWQGVLANFGGLPTPSLELADRCFTWHDDLAFALPESADQRPNAMLDGGVHQINGNYSWLVTVTPSPSENTLTAVARRLYSVSVVVFHKRNLTRAQVDIATGLQDPIDLVENPRPSERTVTANILGGGLGGGSVKLTVRSPDGSTTAEQYGEYLNIKKGQWLMLCGTKLVAMGGSGDAVGQQGVFQWYRVVSVGDVFPEWDPPPDPSAPADRMSRMVTLAGPDWDRTWCAKEITDAATGKFDYINLDGDDWTQDAEAVLMDGVVDVYSTTIELDRSLIWGR